MAIGLAQSGANPWDFRVVEVVRRFFQGLTEGAEARRAASLVARVRRSEPKVYVDGQLAGPLEFDRAATMNVLVPGEGLYSITVYRPGVAGWVEAGRVHGNAIEFQAGRSHVRIECSQAIADSDSPVFARRRR